MPFRNSPRNNEIRRRGFFERCAELLPNSSDSVQAKSNVIFGPAITIPQPIEALRKALESRIQYSTFFAKGKAVEVTLHGEICPDGTLETRFVKCMREVEKVSPSFQWKFQLRKNGVIVPLPMGEYRILRGVLLPAHVDDGSDCELLVEESLRRKGGLFRVKINDNGVVLSSMQDALATWKLLLRLCRSYQNPAVKREIMRRARAEVPFEFSASGNRRSLSVRLHGGRIPKDVSKPHSHRIEFYSSLLKSLDGGVELLLAEGRAMADEFAKHPEVIATEKAGRMAHAVEAVEAARARLLSLMEECCYRSDYTQLVTPADIPYRKKSVSHRQRERFEASVKWFRDAYKEAVDLGWEPTLAYSEGARTGQQSAGQAVLEMSLI